MTRPVPFPRWLAPARLPACAALVLALGACGGGGDELPPAPRKVLVERVDALQPTVSVPAYVGQVQSATDASLAFQVPGRVARIAVTDGQRVSAGDLLAELDDTDYQLQVREARAQVRQQEADVARRRALRDEGILAPAALEPLEAQLESARVQLASAERELSHTRLRAPFDGAVGQRLVDVDAVVDAGTQVFRLLDDRRIEVAMDLPERVVAGLPLNPSLQAEGELLAVTPPLRFPLAYKEHVTTPSDEVRTFRVVLSGEPVPGATLLPGMAVRVHLGGRDAAPAPAATRIPFGAVVTDAQGAQSVWLFRDGDEAVRHAVKVTGIEGAHAVIDTPLPADARLVVAGARLMREGGRFDPVERR